MSDFGTWYRSVPYFTRHWLSLTIGFTLLGRFGLVSPRHFVLLYEQLVHNFQIWRPITSLFYYHLSPHTGFHFLINLYFLYNYSLRLESGHFAGRPADYLFMLVFNWICTVIIALAVELPLLMDPMVLSVLCVWCQLNADVIVSFWFGTRFKAMYLPWVLLAFNAIIMHGGLPELLGIVVGHLYHFFAYRYPLEFGGPQLIQTPSIFHSWFPSTVASGGFGRAPSQEPQRGTGRHNWGRGFVLGDQ